MSSHGVRLIIPGSGGKEPVLSVRKFNIFCFLSSLTVTSHIPKTNTPSLFFETPYITLTRLKLLSFFLMLSNFLQCLCPYAMINLLLYCFTLFHAALNFSGNISLNYLSNLSSTTLIQPLLLQRVQLTVFPHFFGQNSFHFSRKSSEIIWIPGFLLIQRP